MKLIYSIFMLLLITLPASGQNVPEATGSKVSQKDAQSALDFHNKVRKDVGCPPLEWSAELAMYAQAWADNLAKEDCKMKHRPREGKWKQIHGENIYWGSASYFTALNASENWYSEIKVYKHVPITAENFHPIGHYTQMVWKTTTKVGLGQAVCKNGETIVVGNYDPPGNYIGQKAY
ncbi:hypothetical protein WSM22_01640 [Cytophagales bacterium WSM2-2]|nr:hypothetical protein WSM22_01640 [Cytophagales bacterium WSM2-2]